MTNTILNKVLQAADSLVSWTLERHPEFKELADKCEFKKLQRILENKFSKIEKLHYVETNLFQTEERKNAVQQYCEENQLNFKLVTRTLALLSLHRRISTSVLANMLKKYFKQPKDLFEYMDKIVELNLVLKQGNTYITQPAFAMSKEQEDEMELFQSNPCMIYKPKKAYKTKNNVVRNGYLSIKRGAFTRKAEGTDEIPLEFINTQNQIPYRINFAVWEGYIKYNPEMPDRSVEDDDASYDKKIKEAWRHHFKKCFILKLFKELGIDEIYILNMFDYRGRNYPIAYLFNPQGQDADKALLCFEPAPINEQGITWLKISIANNFNCDVDGKSLDKHTYDVRLNWFKETVEPMLDLPYEAFSVWLTEKAKEAESPACFWAQAQNMWFIQDAVNHAQVPMCWVITHFDATASGYQLQAIFARDRNMAKLTNLINNKDKERVDLYSVLYEALIAQGLPSHYTRNQVKKKCFVPAVYNSSRSIKELFTNEEEVKIFYRVMNHFSMWRMNRLFPSLWDKTKKEYSWYMPDGFKVYKKNYEKRDFAFEHNEGQIILSFYENKGLDYSLELGPNITHACDGMVARELARRLDWNPKWKNWLKNLYANPLNWKESDFSESELKDREEMKNLLSLANIFNFYSMRILREIKPHTIDLVPEEIFMKLFNELPEEPCHVSEIHDSFGVHPNHVSALVGQYKMILRDLVKSWYLPVVIKQLTGMDDSRFNFGRDDEFAEEIMKSIYPLC